ncbi:sugar phosphate isomerase/epimerase [Acetatifactor muris]|uniref:Xylose isomerase-like TIM barrel n=1 Tax=Acetatifactor muris TaxID=879566 RepID=A0A2K4ZCZ4_9FIRM|nr:sugar phosphate isomerase/epimerase [Acetatifactor muris]MCR2046732.1 sugar phosphate isomerase/epimerase [Acetatifactor muris]SOY28324.1 Xylose isomerase-like TIM barrel [Acetatifactor muris]
MKLGTFTVALGDLPFEEACRFLAERGVQMVEIGCGGFPGKAHCDGAELLADERKRAAFLETLDKYHLEISALSSHGNMVHPNPKVAQHFEEDFTNAILLAEKLKVPVVNTFSGCPGGSREDVTPNWVTCPWPDDFSEILEYQWNEVLVPYWKEKAAFAEAHGVSKIALELHPGFCVYNTKTLLRLRREVGPQIGANFDPSHLIWQGMDPGVSIRELGKEGAIFHFHAKDTGIDAVNTAMNGVLDTTHYGEELERSWIFRTVGYGHGEDYWKNIISQLRMVGYDYAISIEHEDGLMSGKEGLEKAIRFLQNVLIHEDRGAMYWA